MLFRTSHHCGQLEIELARRNIPFVKFGGLKFLEAAHVKDVLAVLRWAENPRDRVTGFRVLQLLPGVGPATARRCSMPWPDVPAIDALAIVAAPPAKARELGRRSGRADAASACAGAAGRPRSSWCGAGTSRISSSCYEDAVVRAGDLEQLERIAAGYPSREAFLTDLTLDPPERRATKPARRCSTRTT